MPLLRTSFRVGRLGCTCTVLACAETREALVIDPGDEAPRILATLAEQGLTAVRLVHTHAHFDHVLGTAALARATGAEPSLHKDDRGLFDYVPRQLEAFGMEAAPFDGAGLSLRELNGDEVLGFGRQRARVIHTPGHTPGSICLHVEAAAEEGAARTSILFAGDTLFAGSIGRTDLWGGDFSAIVDSIRGPLFSLADETLVIPGHGPETTIGLEREDNPFVGKFARP
ncbi:MAG TPA: MBL fold metallo-hydrolase [Polyangia bacterium]